MARRVLPLLFLVGAAGLSGCSLYQKPQRPAWRAAAENACFAEKRVRLSAYVQPAAEISGPGICGMTRPLKVTALQGGAVRLNTTATLDCSMTADLDAWLEQAVQPSAQARFGVPVVQVNSMGGYTCRGMNNQVGARLSEHSFGNALDIGGFVLADGRTITVRRDWTQGDEQTQAFLREAAGGACDVFTTVLAPGSNIYHYDHIHLDLAMHGSTSRGLRRVCKPVIKNVAPPPRRDDLPDAPEVEEETDMAQAKTLPGSQNAYAMRGGPSGALPPAPPQRPLAAMSAIPRPPATIRADGAFDPGDDEDVTSTTPAPSR